jgi:hypothetical protein
LAIYRRENKDFIKKKLLALGVPLEILNAWKKYMTLSFFTLANFVSPASAFGIRKITYRE